MAKEGFEQPPDSSQGKTGQRPPRASPQERARDDLRQIAEQAIEEAAEAVWQAISARARLYASAPLDHAENRLGQAREHLSQGAYREARTLAQQALSSADQALGHALNRRRIRLEQQHRRRNKWVWAAIIMGLGLIGIRWAAHVWWSHAVPSGPLEYHLELDPRGVAEAADPAAVENPPPAAPSGPPNPASRETISDPETTTAARERFVQVTASRLKVRDRPQGTALPGQRLLRGATVRVLDEQGDWLQIDLGQGRTGWIAQRYTQETSAP